MTDQTDNVTPTVDSAEELKLLKTRADFLNITYSNNIRVETLRKKIEDHLEGNTEENEDEAAADEDQEEESQLEDQDAPKEQTFVEPDFTKMSKKDIEIYLRNTLRDEALKLIRIRVACLDPKKKEVPGEIFSTGNKYIGTIKKFVPFGEATDVGYHVPNCIYEMMKSRKFLQITNTRDRRTGVNITKTRYVAEFAIEVLPPLTEAELHKLAVEQQASGRLREDD
jgi:hypothetical protein